MIYLLFLAGLEMGVRRFSRGSLTVTLGSFLAPFLLGVLAGCILGVEPLPPGTLLSTTSVGVVLPILRGSVCDGDVKLLTVESALLVDCFYDVSLGFLS